MTTEAIKRWKLPVRTYISQHTVQSYDDTTQDVVRRSEDVCCDCEKQDKTRLSCLVLSCRRCTVNWVRDSRRQFSIYWRQNSFVQSRLRCGRILRTSLDPVSKYDVTIDNHMFRANWKLGQDKTRLSSHRISRLDNIVSKFSVADSLDLSQIQFTPRTPTRQDETVLSCRCRRCELAITHRPIVKQNVCKAML